MENLRIGDHIISGTVEERLSKIEMRRLETGGKGHGHGASPLSTVQRLPPPLFHTFKECPHFISLSTEKPNQIEKKEEIL